MILSWRATNFKAIKSIEVDFKNINVILGSNSIGKSSLLHSILAAAQMSEEKSQGKSSYSMIGYAIDLGGPSEVIHRPKLKTTEEFEAATIELTGEYSTRTRNRSVTRTLKLNAKDHRSVDFHVLENSSSQQISSELELQLNLGDGGQVELFLTHRGNQSKLLAHFDKPSRYPRVAEWADQVYDIAYLTWLGSVEPSEASLFDSKRKVREDFAKEAPRFFADFFEAQGHPATEEDSRFFREGYLARRGPDAMDGSGEGHVSGQPLRFSRENMLSLFRAITQTNKLLGAYETSSQVSTWLTELAFRRATSPLHELVLYLGPLRVVSLSEQVNRRSPSTLIPAGRQGEHLPHLLMTQGKEKGSYPMPDGQVKDMTLISAANEWLNFFSPSGPLRSEPIQGLTTKIRLGRYGLNQLGTGVSQILPVIVLSLLGTQGSGKLVLIEQPELHLHPDLQRLLADFFAILSRTKVRFLIETHSEYLVTRLRLLAARKEIAAGDLSLLFAEKATGLRTSGEVSYTQVPIDELGRAEYWPQGFFANAMNDRFELAAIQMSYDD